MSDADLGERMGIRSCISRSADGLWEKPKFSSSSLSLLCLLCMA